MKNIRIIHWLVLGSVLFLLLGVPIVVYASDCDEPTDCAAAADTARNPLTPIVGAAAGTAVGAWVGTRSGRKKPDKTKDGSGASNPCQGVSQEWLIARSKVTGTMRLIQKLRDYHAFLDQQYEITRFKTTSSALIDLGFIGQSVLGKSFKGSMVQNAMFSAIKGLLKEELKQFTDQMVIGGDLFDPSKLGEKGLTSGGKKAFLDQVQKLVTRDVGDFMVNVATPGTIDPLGPVGKALQQGFRSNAEQLAKNLTKFVDVAWSTYNMVSGALDGQKLLDQYKELMSDIRGQIFDLETELDTVLDPAVREALSNFRGCMQIWVDKHGSRWQQRWADRYGEDSLKGLLNSGIGSHLAGQGMQWSNKWDQ